MNAIVALEPCERRAEAEVDAVPEREVAVVAARSTSNCSDSSKCVASRFAAASEMMTWPPSGIVTPPISTSSAA